MKTKNILLLPLVAVLSACVVLDDSRERFQSGTDRVVIEEKGVYEIQEENADEVDALEMEQANFEWHDDEQVNTNTSHKKATQKVLEAFTANGGKLVLYFDYDSADIYPVTKQEIEKHIDFMQTNPDINLRLEGHADERGTREYNLALSENRALSIKSALGTELEHRIEVVSYGEEKPVSTKHDKNRRVEFIYE